MIVHRIAGQLTCAQRFKKLLRQFYSPPDASIDVIALLKIYVLEKVSSDGSCRDGNSVHLDARQMRNGPFNGHEPFAQIFIDRELAVAPVGRGIVLKSSLNSRFLKWLCQYCNDVPQGLRHVDLDRHTTEQADQ